MNFTSRRLQTYALALSLSITLAPIGALADQGAAPADTASVMVAAENDAEHSSADSVDESTAPDASADTKASEVPSDEKETSKTDITDVSGEKGDSATDTKTETNTTPEEPKDEKTADGVAIISGGAWQTTESGAKQYVQEDGSLLKDGLFVIDGKRYYFDEEGQTISGWKDIELNGETQRFYFLETGEAATGLQKIGESYYLFDEDTAYMEKGWQSAGESRYYLADSGEAATGWQNLDGTWYYFDPASAALKTGWLYDDGFWYWLDEQTGAMHTGWVKVKETWYYCDGTGRMQTGWLNRNGSWYWLDWNSGAMATGWQDINGSRYYFNPINGAMQAGWLQDGDSWYLLDNSTGAMKTGWVYMGGAWYHLASSGKMQTGWQAIDGSWYLLSDSGAMLTGWQKVDGVWYYLSSSGAMATGWQQINGSWYYLDTSGAMQTGWINLGGSWYYLAASGAMCTRYYEVDGVWYYSDPSSGCALHECITYDSAWGEYVIIGSDWHAHTYTGTVLPVPWYINQYAEGAPEGCEGASLLMALWSKGYCLDMTYKQFLKTMPYATDGNPYHGFVGTPYANDGNFDTIMMPAVAAWGARYAHTRDMTGCSVYDMLYELSQGHPVIVWTSYKFRSSTRLEYWWGSYKTNNHVMLLRGFDAKTNTFYVADPYIDGMEWISWRTFMNSWTVLRGAVSVW